MWARLLKVIDCELANQLVDEAHFGTIAEMEFAKEQIAALESLIQVSMPFFWESIDFVTNYEMIIRQSIPFENYRLHLQPDFIVALVFMVKRKGLSVLCEMVLSWTAFASFVIDAFRIMIAFFIFNLAPYPRLNGLVLSPCEWWLPCVSWPSSFT